LFSFVLVLRIRPNLILANGPGTCLPILVSGYITRFLGITPNCKLVLLESYACVSHPSLTVRMLNKFVDMLCVQWPKLKIQYPNSIFTGRVNVDSGDNDRYFTYNNNLSYVFVTVGSTKYEELIRAIDDVALIEKMKKMGFTGIHIQTGRGEYVPVNIKHSKDFEVVVYDFNQDIKEEVENCSLVIGHGGIGTIFEVLGLKKKLLVVPNLTLMNNHQVEIAEELHSKDHLDYTDTEHISEALDKIDFTRVKDFPETETGVFKVALSSLLRLDVLKQTYQ